ncbi:unnamed protein product [Porites evermanni]|uniref:Uncharacterized protein n=1 Tax=Porites evermanni TaxID=104178 RepID=A0ABN8SCC7_9CNID|nr:unnamed protein product [Porites evermanni]
MVSDRLLLNDQNTEFPLFGTRQQLSKVESLPLRVEAVGIEPCQISKLQRVQNAAARIALDVCKFCHITPALRQLHLLPVVKQIQFKILLLTFKAIHGLSPPYISKLITVKPKSTYGRRSNISTLLLPPTQKMLPTLGARSFAAAAPALWNKLPAHIRNVASLNSFKKSIKTFIINESL